MDAKIESQKIPFEVDTKRFYVPGNTLKVTCPRCKEKVNKDFSEDYLSYPMANQPFTETVYCGNCENEFDVQLRLNISLEVYDIQAEKAKENERIAAKFVEDNFFTDGELSVVERKEHSIDYYYYQASMERTVVVRIIDGKPEFRRWM